MVIVVGILVAAAPPASAERGGHCVFRLEPVERVGTILTATLRPLGCFPTLEEALEVGLEGAIDIPGTVTPQNVTESMVATEAGPTSVVLGTEYDLNSYTGSSNSYTAPSTCTASTTWQVANVGVTWNDRFQSGKGFGGCDTNRKFQHENFGGNVKVCTPNCGDYGILANQVTALRWRI